MSLMIRIHVVSFPYKQKVLAHSFWHICRWYQPIYSTRFLIPPLYIHQSLSNRYFQNEISTMQGYMTRIHRAIY